MHSAIKREVSNCKVKFKNAYQMTMDLKYYLANNIGKFEIVGFVKDKAEETYNNLLDFHTMIVFPEEHINGNF